MNFRISEITVEETRPLRQQVLRPGLPAASVTYAEDSKPGSFFLGFFMDEKLVTVASFYPASNPLFDKPIQYQLRGMATDPAYRNLQAGKRLMDYAICRLQELKADILWCNGRLVALSFYERLGFVAVGEMFLSVDIPHKILVLDLKVKAGKDI